MGSATRVNFDNASVTDLQQGGETGTEMPVIVISAVKASDYSGDLLKAFSIAV
jgi:hypothetical protein